MRFQITHTTDYEYETPAQRLVMRLRLFPRMYDGQYVESWQVSVNDQEVSPMSLTGSGDESSLWTSPTPLDSLTITAKGVVEVQDVAGVVTGLSGRAPTGMFRRFTDLTRPDDALKHLADQITADAGLSWLHALNEAVQEAVVYTSGSTDAATSAAEALAAGKGVCQDQAHVFITAARLGGYAARYVVGYLYDPETPELETHGWAEAHVPNLGWVGFDPSHNQCPTDHYVRLTCGLDAHDATPIRGCVLGGSDAPAKARVEMVPETE